MHAGFRFSELSDSLKNGFLADQVVLALARAEKGQSLSELERNNLKKAADLLEYAKEGHRWLDHPKLNDSTSTFAASFGQAMDALPDITSSEDFLQHVSTLHSAAVQLAEGKIPEKEQIRALRTFFFNAGRTQLSKTTDLLKGESKAPSTLRWKATRE